MEAERHIISTNAIMILDLIEEVLESANKPEKAAETVIRLLRELTGTKIITIILKDEDTFIPLGIIPKRKSEILKNNEFITVIYESFKLVEPDFLLNLPNLDDNTLQFLDTHKITNSLISPLIADSSIIGSIMMLGLPDDTYGKDQIFKILKMLTGTVSLVFSNSILFSKQQSLIQKLESSIIKLESTQAQLIESEKMAALGDLVAGVAHEINTPVGIGVTAASHMSDETYKIMKTLENQTLCKSQLIEYLKNAKECSKIILSNLDRASTLIQGFKGVAVDQSAEDIRKFNLNSYLEDILLSINTKIKHTRHNVKIECKEEYEVETYPGALSQIITNLIFNSLIHGFEDREEGLITISIDKIENNIVIDYIDNGCGIPDENLNKIYDPFFTTKRGNGGSGLGLNITYNLVVQKLKGTIYCTSEPCKGTQFHITFPSELKE